VIDDSEVLEKYYSRRAQQYEQIYRRDDPIRHSEQSGIAGAMRKALANRRVLEVACGTGYWTEIAAQVARHIVAIDISPEMLAEAQIKGLDHRKVEFRQGDAYALQFVPGRFDAGLANFWFSHVPRARIDEFLHGFHKRIGVGSTVFMADNVYVSAVGGELVARPGCENTFKWRKLPDGSEHEVLKNYCGDDELRQIFAPRAINLEVHSGDCFWWITYVVA